METTIVVSKYTEKLCYEAKLVALKAHGDQPYDGIFPYEKHLNDVVEILRNYNYTGIFVVAGWLHDSIEDGNLSYNKIKQYFGKEVAEIVFAVTDELGRNRWERKAKTYPKIRNNHDAIIIKLADRIANIQHGGKIDMYRDEHPEFREALYVPGIGEGLWKRLESLIAA